MPYNSQLVHRNFLKKKMGVGRILVGVVAGGVANPVTVP